MSIRNLNASSSSASFFSPSFSRNSLILGSIVLFLSVLGSGLLERARAFANSSAPIAVPDNSYPNVTGTDLTYGVTDRFLVTEGTQIKEYKVRHDFIFVAPETGDIFTREGNPQFAIEE